MAALSVKEKNWNSIYKEKHHGEHEGVPRDVMGWKWRHDTSDPFRDLT